MGNGCANKSLPLAHKILGAFIILGGLLHLIGAIMSIVDWNCQDDGYNDDYVCCACYSISFLCVFGSLFTVLIGIDLVTESKITQIHYIALFILGVLIDSIWIIGNTEEFGHEYGVSYGGSFIIAYIGLMVFGILAIVAIVRKHGGMAKYVGILFGCCLLVTFYSILHVNNVYRHIDVMYAGIGVLIVYN